MSDSKADILYQAASVWNELTEYNYLLTYGCKNKLYEINLTFSPEDFPHLAGFQYLKDIVLPRYSPQKTVSRILDGTIRAEQIQKKLFSYMPRMYPFYTHIKADYLISHHSDTTCFVFIIHANTDSSAKCNYLCCSAFKQQKRNYETNQRSRTVLKKERLHIRTNTSTILLDKLSTKK